MKTIRLWQQGHFIARGFAITFLLWPFGNVFAGQPFDFLGYSALYVIKAVAAEEKIAGQIDVTLTKSELCRNRTNCSAIKIQLPVTTSLFLGKAVIALSNPCAYSTEHSVTLKNPDIATAKSKPHIDGKEFFCGQNSGKAAIAITLTETSSSLTNNEISVLIMRNETIR